MNFKKPFSFEILLIFLSIVILSEAETPLCRKLPNCFKTKNSCSCGKSQDTNLTKLDGRIVGGEPAKPHEFPWQVGIAFAGKGPFCGGTLISESFVVSAAHCFYTYQLHYSKMVILLGVHDYSKLTTAHLQQKIEYVKIHPNFQTRNYINDIALIKMSSPVQLTSAIQPICLPRSGKDYVGTFATVTGWGRTSDNGPVSSVLMKVDIPIRGEPLCHEFLDSAIPITTLLCGYYNKGQKDACRGDSGSGMIVKDSEHWFFIGLVSSGAGCAEPMTPAYYTRIDRYYKWILSYTEGGYFCDPKREKKKSKKKE